MILGLYIFNLIKLFDYYIKLFIKLDMVEMYYRDLLFWCLCILEFF